MLARQRRVDRHVPVLAADPGGHLGRVADRARTCRSGSCSAAGWLIVLLSTFLINHFELFGLQQAWFHARSRQPRRRVPQPFFYRWVAHPLYSGFFIAFWATPTMTAGHLLFAVGMSVYILIAIRYEERDLGACSAREYDDYRASVGMLTPKFHRKSAKGVCRAGQKG